EGLVGGCLEAVLVEGHVLGGQIERDLSARRPARGDRAGARRATRRWRAAGRRCGRGLRLRDLLLKPGVEFRRRLGLHLERHALVTDPAQLRALATEGL